MALYHVASFWVKNGDIPHIEILDPILLAPVKALSLNRSPAAAYSIQLEAQLSVPKVLVGFSPEHLDVRAINAYSI